MEEEESTFSHRWFMEVWNKGNTAAIDEMLDDNVIIHGLNFDGQGIEPFKLFYREFNDSFKDIHIEVEHVMTVDGYEAARCSARGVQRLSNREVSFTGMVMIKIKDGKAIEAWNNFDFLSMYLQLGQTLK